MQHVIQFMLLVVPWFLSVCEQSMNNLPEKRHAGLDVIQRHPLDVFQPIPGHVSCAGATPISCNKGSKVASG